MRCPKCEHEKQKILSSIPFGEETMRKRLCVSCGHKFTTYEKAVEEEDEG